ncbi:hypothetical protein HOC01_06460 [archaeon]|jgi:hypothetical protein|nr:hypothetical protein [archaeon]MBT6697517.1 hypothetical protein [archaeon]
MAEGKETSALARKEALEKLEQKKEKELERLRREKEKEIAKLKAEIADAANEASATEAFEEKVPIPQVASRDLSGVSAEAKEIILQQRAGSSKKRFGASKDDEDSVTKKVESDVASSLDEQVDKEHVDMGKIGAIPAGYGMPDVFELARVPVASLYEQMRNIYEGISSKGYVSSQEQTQMYNLGSAIEQKVQDVEAGNYSFNERAAKMASVSLTLKDKTSNMYVVTKDGKSMQDQYRV